VNTETQGSKNTRSYTTRSKSFFLVPLMPHRLTSRIFFMVVLLQFAAIS